MSCFKNYFVNTVDYDLKVIIMDISSLEFEVSEVRFNEDSQSIDILKNELDTDFDRGVQKFAELYLLDQNVLSKIFMQNVENELILKKLKRWKKIWTVAKWTGITIAAVSLFYSFDADTITQLINASTNGEIIARTVIVITSSGLVVISSGFAAISWCLSGRKHLQYKKLSELQEKDCIAVKKLRIILETWGAMTRSNESLEINRDLDLDLDEKIDRCFKKIKKLPKQIDNIELPSKSKLTSQTINLCDANHPIKRLVNSIVSQQGSEDENKVRFEDKGQQGMDGNSQEYNDENFDSEIKYSWRELQHKLSGIKVRKIYLSKDVFVKNPLYR